MAHVFVKMRRGDNSIGLGKAPRLDSYQIVTFYQKEEFDFKE
jgi:hypothetical protein